MRLSLALLCLFCLCAGETYCSQCQTAVQSARTKGCSNSECMAPIIKNSCTTDHVVDAACAGTLYECMDSLTTCLRLNGDPATCCTSAAQC